MTDWETELQKSTVAVISIDTIETAPIDRLTDDLANVSAPAKILCERPGTLPTVKLRVCLHRVDPDEQSNQLLVKTPEQDFRFYSSAELKDMHLPFYLTLLRIWQASCNIAKARTIVTKPSVASTPTAHLYAIRYEIRDFLKLCGPFVRIEEWDTVCFSCSAQSAAKNSAKTRKAKLSLASAEKLDYLLADAIGPGWKAAVLEMRVTAVNQYEKSDSFSWRVMHYLNFPKTDQFPPL